jgi:hypothetical protein
MELMQFDKLEPILERLNRLKETKVFKDIIDPYDESSHKKKESITCGSS